MAYRDPKIGLQRGRERFQRRVAERRARNLCPRCGKVPPAPGLSVCSPCGEKRRAAGRARDARLRAADKPRRNPDRARTYGREHHRRLTAERVAQGLCPKCGKQPPAPERNLCGSCGEKRREAKRARYAKAKARGALYGGRGVESKRRSARAGSRRLRLQRLAEGRCTRCGANSPIQGRTVCEPCRETCRAREREQYVARRSTGLCGKCGVATFEGASRCAPCAVLDSKRQDRKNAASRARYARRRTRNQCTDCDRRAMGAARCPECARRSWARSAEHRGLPVFPSRLTVIDTATGDNLGTFDSEAEVAACLVFAKLSRDQVEVTEDTSAMNSLTSW